jgi:hypothetical protein
MKKMHRAKAPKMQRRHQKVGFVLGGIQFVEEQTATEMAQVARYTMRVERSVHSG